jgi:hypothetical protein
VVFTRAYHLAHVIHALRCIPPRTRDPCTSDASAANLLRSIIYEPAFLLDQKRRPERGK